MSAKVGRNDPCACGSGRKYKNCCEGKTRLGRRAWILGAVGLLVVAAVAWGLMRPKAPSPAPGGMLTPQAGSSAGIAPVGGGSEVPAPPGVAATPWAYDPATNRHFDPTHGHWHEGPPPSAAARGGLPAPPVAGAQVPGAQVPNATGAAPTATTPAPWTYDPAKNQHWDPTHGHWHPGPPPAGSR